MLIGEYEKNSWKLRDFSPNFQKYTKQALLATNLHRSFSKQIFLKCMRPPEIQPNNEK